MHLCALKRVTLLIASRKVCRTQLRLLSIALKDARYVKGVEHEDTEKIRNIGIMAHIDAGKTTTTERMLYYSGISRHLGSVDAGDTVTDYMEQERERGITITSAAVTFYWNKHKVNLIDTPGHVDFTVEVERSLRVLDGAVAVLDASAGVEAQTLTVWRQANRYHVPRIVYLNKMDKPGANLDMCLSSLKEKLHVEPIVINLPYETDSQFAGVVDLVTLEQLVWDTVKDPKGNTFKSVSLLSSECDIENGDWRRARNTLIGQLADVDETIADYVLSDKDLDELPANIVRNALRNVTLSHKAVLVLCGSSLKNKGVQPLLDAITYYLPSPLDVSHPFLEYYQNELCALAFKIIHDKQRGALTFLRIYGGLINSGQHLYNVNLGVQEKISRLLQVYADEYKDIKELGPGNIVCVAGLKETRTGDTLTSSHQAVRKATKHYRQLAGIDHEEEPRQASESDTDDDFDMDREFTESDGPILAGVQVPEPVFFCSIEAESIMTQTALDKALLSLQREDPSFKVEVAKETGQTIISGMGELHIDIIRRRLHDEYGVEAYLGPLQIAYHEMIDKDVRHTGTLSRIIGERNNRVTMALSLHPSPDCPTFKQVKTVQDEHGEHITITRKQLQAVNSGVSSALKYGPILHSPVMNVEVQLHSFEISPGTALPVISACAAQSVHKMYEEAECFLMEPVMFMEISTDDDHTDVILGDIARRRGHIKGMLSHHNVRVIQALTPLSELMGYSTDIRVMTSGTGTFTMELSHYQRMTAEEQRQAIDKTMGLSSSWTPR